MCVCYQSTWHFAQEQAKRIWLCLAQLDGQSGILIRGILRYAVISNEQSLFRCCKWTRVCMYMCVVVCVYLCVYGIIMINECIAANLILTSTGAGLILKSCMLLYGRKEERGESERSDVRVILMRQQNNYIMDFNYGQQQHQNSYTNTHTHTMRLFDMFLWVCMRFRIFEILKFTQLTHPIKK